MTNFVITGLVWLYWHLQNHVCYLCSDEWTHTHTPVMSNNCYMREILQQCGRTEEIKSDTVSRLVGLESRFKIGNKIFTLTLTHSRPPFSLRFWHKLQALVYDILPWKEVPESDARSVILTLTDSVAPRVTPLSLVTARSTETTTALIRKNWMKTGRIKYDWHWYCDKPV